MSQLPTLADLHADHSLAFKHDAFNELLSNPPSKSWVKKHPMTKNEYLPIDKVEFLLKRIFGEVKIEVLSYAAIFQSVAVHVRLHYKNPVTSEWSFQDGLGAAPIQTDAGKSAADLGAIKAVAVQIALPSAESYAIKDAAEKLGELFGSNLSRKDTIQFQGFFTNQARTETPTQTETPSTEPAQFDQL